MRRKLSEYAELPLGTGYRQTTNCTGGLLGSRIFYAYALKRLMISWPNYTRGCVAVIQGDVHWHIKR